jgi:hypothetical protein
MIDFIHDPRQIAPDILVRKRRSDAHVAAGNVVADAAREKHAAKGDRAADGHIVTDVIVTAEDAPDGPFDAHAFEHLIERGLLDHPELDDVFAGSHNET